MTAEYLDWTSEDVRNHLMENPRLEDCAHCFTEHDINGMRLLKVTTEDLKEMGVKTLGDRLAIIAWKNQLGLEDRRRRRNTIIDEEIQAYDDACLERMFQTCCGICPWDPDKLTLSQVSLKVLHYDISRLCGMCKCVCWGGEWTTDSINLGTIQQVSTEETKVGCCPCLKEDRILLKITSRVGTGIDGAKNEREGAKKAEEGADLQILPDQPPGHDGAGEVEGAKPSGTARISKKNLLLHAETGQAFADKLRDMVKDYRLTMM